MMICVPIVYYVDEDKPSHVAFLDTVTDTFVDFNGVQIFDSKQDLSDWCTNPELLNRLLALVPDWLPDIVPEFQL